MRKAGSLALPLPLPSTCNPNHGREHARSYNTADYQDDDGDADDGHDDGDGADGVKMVVMAMMMM
eukprot:5579442-Alexandrium_andersonii.AAC.1